MAQTLLVGCMGVKGGGGGGTGYEKSQGSEPVPPPPKKKTHSPQCAKEEQPGVGGTGG